MNHFYQDIPGYMNYEPLYAAAVRAAPATAHFVEVGSLFGRSAAYLAVEIINAGKWITVDLVDNFSGPGASAALLRQQLDRVLALKDRNPIRYIRALDSVAAAAMYADGELDFVFVDADHSAAAVAADLLAWWPKIKAGGVLAGHDYDALDWPGVVAAVNEFAAARGLRVDTQYHYCWRLVRA